MHREIGHADLTHIGPEHRGDLGVDAADRLGAGRTALRERAEVEGVNRRRLGIGSKEQSVTTEREWANRLERRADAVGRTGHRTLGGGRNRERHGHGNGQT